MVTVVLINAALAGLLIVVIARAGVAYRRPRARIGWLAAVLGALALLTQGTIIPLPALDGLLGGTNVLKLVQNILTLVALWLGVQAGTAPADARVRSLRWWLPGVLAALFVAVFLAIPDRGTTSFRFVETGAHTSAAIWLYGVVHMTGIAVIGVLPSAAATLNW